MGGLWTKAADCECKEYGRLLREQFINGLDEEAWCGILREVSALEDTDDATKKRELLWAQRKVVQRV